MKFSTDLKGFIGILGTVATIVVTYAPAVQQVIPNPVVKDSIGIALSVASGILLILADAGVTKPTPTESTK